MCVGGMEGGCVRAGDVCTSVCTYMCTSVVYLYNFTHCKIIAMIKRFRCSPHKTPSFINAIETSMFKDLFLIPLQIINVQVTLLPVSCSKVFKKNEKEIKTHFSGNYNVLV